MLSSILPLQDDEGDVSFDVETLFTNISIEKTMNYIIEQIYVHKKVTPIWSKLIFTRLMTIFVTECAFKLNSRFLKQVDGYTIRGPLPGPFRYI